MVKNHCNLHINMNVNVTGLLMILQQFNKKGKDNVQKSKIFTSLFVLFLVKICNYA